MSDEPTALVIRLDKATKERLIRKAKAEERSLSSYVRVVLINHLKNTSNG